MRWLRPSLARDWTLSATARPAGPSSAAKFGEGAVAQAAESADVCSIGTVTIVLDAAQEEHGSEKAICGATGPVEVRCCCTNTDFPFTLFFPLCMFVLFYDLKHELTL